ncbi:MiaB/RimO family radical SAM methylthiotransferase [Chloroflexota bacterium]
MTGINILKYHIWTIGCQMNKAESERLSSLFEAQGYHPVSIAIEADIIVLNSCVVRQSAENRVINKLHSLKSLKKSNPGVILALTGCYVKSDIDSLADKFPHIDYFFKPGELPPWLEKTTPEQLIPQRPSPTVYIPITQGCNNFCSYCIVPYRRGRERSRLPSEIICEVSEFVNRGAKEVTLLGQNVDSYGNDLPEKPTLAALLYELNGIDGLARIRFLTNHPKDMSFALIEAVASLEKVCEQITLPVQAGDNDILKLMRRDYTVEHYRRLIEEIRSKVPGVALSTDIIVGFPSETEEQYRHTFDLLSEIRFDTVHSAAYSPREGTIAARELDDDVPAEEKSRRLSEVEELQESIVTEKHARLLGETVEVLVEAKKKGKWQGRTRSDKLVFFSDSNDRLGQLVDIRIDKTGPWSLQGKIKNTENK